MPCISFRSLIVLLGVAVALERICAALRTNLVVGRSGWGGERDAADARVTVHVSDVSAADALDAVLGQLRTPERWPAYRFVDNVLRVEAVSHFDSPLSELRVYRTADRDVARDVAEAIQREINPEHWRQNGG